MFSGWMLLWFSPNMSIILTAVGRPWIVRPSTCTDAVSFKQLSHFVLCWGSWQWTSNPATICPCSTLSAFCGCAMTCIASDWLTLPCFLSLQWLKRLFSGLSAVCPHTSAGEPRAAASLQLGSSRLWSVAQICHLRVWERGVLQFISCFSVTSLLNSPLISFLSVCLLKGLSIRRVWAPTVPDFITFCLSGIPVRSRDRSRGRVNKAARGSLKLPSYY